MHVFIPGFRLRKSFLNLKKIFNENDFNFEIINFPNMCSNIPASPGYGVYISQLIRYARASSNYSDTGTK
jgi:hypothetical protein